MDKKPYQILGERRELLPVRSGDIAKTDSECCDKWQKYKGLCFSRWCEREGAIDVVSSNDFYEKKLLYAGLRLSKVEKQYMKNNKHVQFPVVAFGELKMELDLK